MDGDNNGMLNDMYANMDPSTMGSNYSNNSDQDRCEIR
jgi:hypothetical protein